MGKLAEAYVEINAKTKGLDDGLAASEKSLAGFVSRANSLLGAIGIGLGTAGLVSFLKSATDAGSDLNETLNKVGVVFGSSAGAVTSMAEDMAARFGSVKTVTLDAAANLGLIAQGAGLSTAAATEMATQLVRLANDASSFFNVGLDVALEKIRSGLVGEAEPLRAFGVMLSETAVKAEALRMGIVPLNGELSEHEKVLARVELITRGLAKAQGDAERTIDGYAGAVRRLSGEWENFKSEAGTPLATGSAVMLKLLREQPGDVFKSIFSMGAYQNFNFQDIADKVAGVQHLDPKKLEPPNPAAAKARADMAVFERFAAAMARDRAAAFDAAKFGGGGFGAFGPFGQIGQAINAQAMVPAMEKQIRDRAWSGGWGQMGTMDFLRSAQESILRHKDETAKQQLDELKKIREILAKPQPPKKEGVILRGRA